MPRVSRTTAEKKRQYLKILFNEFNRNAKGITTKEAAQVLVKHGGPKLSERQIRNYLYDLEALGLIKFDDELGVWHRVVEKRQLKKYEYEIAIKHTKELFKMANNYELLTDMYDGGQEFPRLQAISRLLDEIMFEEKHPELADHISTGYYELWVPLLRHKEKLTQFIGKLTKDDLEPDSLEPDSFIYNWKRRPECVQLEAIDDEQKIREIIKRDVRETLNSIHICEFNSKYYYKSEFKTLQDQRISLCVGFLKEIVLPARHGIPLRGECNLCLKKHYSITAER